MAALCDRRRTCKAFRLEFGGLYEHRLQICGHCDANSQWPVIFGTSPFLSPNQLLAWKTILLALFIFHLRLNLSDVWHRGYWCLKLTHWSMIIETCYIFLSWHSVYQARRLIPAPGPTKLPCSIRVTWVLHTIAMPVSLMVALLFWTVDKPFWKTNLRLIPWWSFFLHGMNACLLMFDLLLSRMVYYLAKAWIFLLYIVTYATMTIFHFLFKIGYAYPCRKYPQNECPIYNTLDWHNPVQTAVLILANLFIVAPLAMSFVWSLVHYRQAVDAYMHNSNARDKVSTQELS